MKKEIRTPRGYFEVKENKKMMNEKTLKKLEEYIARAEERNAKKVFVYEYEALIEDIAQDKKVMKLYGLMPKLILKRNEEDATIFVKGNQNILLNYIENYLNVEVCEEHLRQYMREPL